MNRIILLVIIFILIILCKDFEIFENDESFNNLLDKCKLCNPYELNKTDSDSNCINDNINCEKFKLIEFKTKPFLWIFLGNYHKYNYKNEEIPDYLKLSLTTVYKHCNKDYNIRVLNNSNIKKYLPNLNITNIDSEKKMFYVSLLLLYKYGGIWLKPSIIMKNLKIFKNKLNDYDFIGFSCNSNIYRCVNTPNNPNTEIYGSNKNSKFLKGCIHDMENIINSYNYPNYDFLNIGRRIFQKNIIESKTKYYQFDAGYIGTRDYDNKIITVNNFLSQNNTLLWNEDKVLLVLLDINGFSSMVKNKWFMSQNKTHILKSNMWISKLFRKSLDYNKDTYYYTEINNNSNRLFNKEIEYKPENIKEVYKLIKDSNKYFNLPWNEVYNISSRNS